MGWSWGDLQDTPSEVVALAIEVFQKDAKDAASRPPTARRRHR